LVEMFFEVPQKTKNRPTIWPTDTTLGHIAEGI
jgi:hypothetical protein